MTMTIGRKITLALLAVIYGFGFIDRIVIALVAQQIKADFGVSDFQIGLLGGTAFAVVNVFAALPLARLAERRARKWVTALSLLVASGFTLCCAATTSFGQLLVLRLGMAGGSAGTEAPAHSMISDMYPPNRRASAMSLFMLGVPIAALGGSALGGTVAQIYGWRGTFLAIGGLGLVISVAGLLFMREPPREGPAGANPRESIWTILSIMIGNPTVRQVLLGVSLTGLGSFGMNTFLPAFFSRDFGMGPAKAGLVFGLLTGIASLVGTIVGGFGSEWLARRDSRWLIAAPGLGVMIGAPIFVIGLNLSSLTIALSLMFVGSIFFYTAMGPAIATVHSALDSRSRATGSALFLLVMHMIGQGFGPPLAGFISDTVSAASFGAPDFSTRCAGAAGQIPGSACAAAAATGIRYAISIFGMFYLWAGVHLVLAARARN